MAAKDKSGKFSDNFNVTLFLVRPNDQTLQAEFSRSNLVCQGAEPAAPGAESSEDSSEEDEGGAVEIRPRAGAQGAHQARVQSTVVRTLTSPSPARQPSRTRPTSMVGTAPPRPTRPTGPR